MKNNLDNLGKLSLNGCFDKNNATIYRCTLPKPLKLKLTKCRCIKRQITCKFCQCENAKSGFSCNPDNCSHSNISLCENRNTKPI